MPKATEEGERLTVVELPFPESETDCGLPAALSVMAGAPERAPAQAKKQKSQPPASTVDRYSDQEHDPIEDLLIVGPETLADEHDGQYLQKESSDHRPREVSRAAEHSAANEYRGDAEEEVRVSD